MLTICRLPAAVEFVRGRVQTFWNSQWLPGQTLRPLIPTILTMRRLYQREEQGEIYEQHSSGGILKEVEDEAYDYLKSREYRLFDDAEGEKEKKAMKKCKNR